MSSIKVIINIDKPVGWTSFDIVKKVKRITGHKKVGHGGTLDPFASGVLILGTEDDTKNLTEITKSNKSYQAELLLGVKTNTLDPEGEIADKKHIPFLSDDILRKTMKTFEGKQKQIPPMFSAKKRGGVRLYKLARKNIEIERNEIDIEINDISLVSFFEDKIIFNVSCSKGTYIRVLGSDIAKKLGTVGYLINLKRIRVGNYFIKDSISIENFEKSWKSYTR
ncbi:tRNA pseudouridine(55) synthase TruB [bacterium]|nr:MAG: tRNA pseudouridine(55) synthase TruB [bacterium]